MHQTGPSTISTTGGSREPSEVADVVWPPVYRPPRCRGRHAMGPGRSGPLLSCAIPCEGGSVVRGHRPLELGENEVTRSGSRPDVDLARVHPGPCLVYGSFRKSSLGNSLAFASCCEMMSRLREGTRRRVAYKRVTHGVLRRPVRQFPGSSPVHNPAGNVPQCTYDQLSCACRKIQSSVPVTAPPLEPAPVRGTSDIGFEHPVSSRSAAVTPVSAADEGVLVAAESAAIGPSALRAH